MFAVSKLVDGWRPGCLSVRGGIFGSCACVCSSTTHSPVGVAFLKKSLKDYQV